MMLFKVGGGVVVDDGLYFFAIVIFSLVSKITLISTVWIMISLSLTLSGLDFFE